MDDRSQKEDRAQAGAAPIDECIPCPPMMDVAFKLSGTEIPAVHGAALKREVEVRLPWLARVTFAGIHSVHAASSMNGWQRPDQGGDSVMLLPRRAMLVLRVPAERVELSAALSGATLDLDGCLVTVGDYKLRSLKPLTTLFSRQVLGIAGEVEREFLSRVETDFGRLLARFGTLVCGLETEVDLGGDSALARSLMVTGLDRASSLRLQCLGYGPGRKFGCGLFIGHKGVGQLSAVGFEQPE